MGKELFYNKGLHYIKKEKYGKAIAAFKEVIKLDCHDRKSHFCLVFCYIANTQEGLHITHYQQFISLGGEESAVRDLKKLMEIHSLLENPNVSPDHIEKLKDMEVDLTQGLDEENKLLRIYMNRWLANFYFANKHYEKSLAIFNRIKLFYPDCPRSLDLFIADNYVMLEGESNYCKAIAIFQQAFEKNPDLDVSFHIAWGHALKMLEKWDDVLYQIMLVIEKDKNNRWALQLLQKLIANEKFFPRTITDFFLALKDLDHPHYAVFWQIYANKYTVIAKELIAHQQAPNGVRIICFYDPIKTAHQIVDDALSIYPRSIIFHYQKAVLYTLENNHQEAMVFLSKAIGLVSDIFNQDLTDESLAKIYWQHAITSLNFRNYPNFYLLKNRIVFDLTSSLVLGLSAWEEVFNLLEDGTQYRTDIEKIKPIVQEIYRLRNERTKCWKENHQLNRYSFAERARQYNDSTTAINALFNSLHLPEYYEEKLETTLSLFNLTGFFINRHSSQIPNKKTIPPAVKIRFESLSIFKAYQKAQLETKIPALEL